MSMTKESNTVMHKEAEDLVAEIAFAGTEEQAIKAALYRLRRIKSTAYNRGYTKGRKSWEDAKLTKKR